MRIRSSSGAALNLLALGVTGALYRALLGSSGTALVLPTLPALDVPGLRHLPVLGAALFGQHALVYLGLCLTPVLAFVLAHTGLGLRLRALGDHPLAAASLGLPVRSYRTWTLAAGGALAGLGGAALTLAATNTFVEGITAGRGFIALAVVVFGRWSPWGVLGGAMLFGLASALQFQFQAAALADSLPGVPDAAVRAHARGAALVFAAKGARRVRSAAATSGSSRHSPEGPERLLQKVPLARYHTTTPAAAYIRAPSSRPSPPPKIRTVTTRIGRHHRDDLLDTRLAVALVADELRDLGAAAWTATRGLADQLLAASGAGGVVVDRHRGARATPV